MTTALPVDAAAENAAAENADAGTNVVTTGVDPLWVLWHASGEPAPTSAPRDRAGACARCGSFDEAASRVKAVVSDKFTGWESYTRHADPLWCTACTWGHTDSVLRTRPWRIGGGRTVHADRTILAEELAQPVAPLVALVIPVSRHKHLLPDARWGVVTTDDRHLVWEQDEANLFKAVQWLRSLGFTETHLAERTPNFDVLTRRDGGTIAAVVRRWETLSPWRQDRAYLSVACLGSRPPKNPNS